MNPTNGPNAPPVLSRDPTNQPTAGASRRATAAPSPERTLRRLFLTLFLRGRSSRGLRKESAPKSVGSKLGLTLAFYALFGLFALFFKGQPVFALSVYLHGMTFVFLGMFIAASAGEVLFNKEEADILLHRPVTPRTLLQAKVGVLVEVSLWLAGAFNLGGFIVGVSARDGGWSYPLVHAISTGLEALFCTGCVVLTYQVCLRWFGRERLEGLMTTTQVVVAIAAVAAGQIVPRMIGGFGDKMSGAVNSWWVCLLPPAWFAGLDDAIAGGGVRTSWALAALGVVATSVVLWLAFGTLARDYGAGLQTLNEASVLRPRRRARRRWLDWAVAMPPLSWWLRDSVSRAAFLLTAAYLVRDRDVKLRVYPGLAPMLVMPIIFLVQDRGQRGEGGFGVAFAGVFLGLIPVLGLTPILPAMAGGGSVPGCPDSRSCAAVPRRPPGSTVSSDSAVAVDVRADCMGTTRQEFLPGSAASGCYRAAGFCPASQPRRQRRAPVPANRRGEIGQPGNNNDRRDGCFGVPVCAGLLGVVRWLVRVAAAG